MGLKHILKKLLPDGLFLRIQYKAKMGRTLRLRYPVYYSEKLQYMKINDRNPLYSTLVDKIAVKEYVKELIGEEYVIPTYGIYTSFDEIDFSVLPEKFVLKCSHDSGSYVICESKEKLDIEKARRKIERGLRNNYFWEAREWPYKNVRPRIIVEKFIEPDSSTGELDDYKFFCFDGKVDNVMVVTERNTGNPLFYHFDRDWKMLKYNRKCRSLPDDFTLPKPKTMNEMFDIAEKLSKSIPQVRVDLYSSNGKIYFGEYTFFHQCGYETGFDEATEIKMGEKIVLTHAYGK